MGRKYAGYTNATNTTSTTVPLFTLVGAATTRLFVYDVVSGSDATPADAATKLSFRRISGRGTTSATVTPNPLDAANPASLAVFDTGWSTNPTITASSDLLQWAQNQRATFRWVAAPGSELVVPATAGAGLALMSVVASATANYAWTVLWEE
jgi:hypothetical protein